MQRTLFAFIIRHSLLHQLAIVALTLVSFPFLYYSLELPKWIVNNAIETFDPSTRVFGMPVEQVPYLMILSVGFLLLVLINGIFKFHINTLKGRLGERMLRRLRYQLYAQLLRFPLPQFKKMSAGEIIPIITAEVEPLGGFIGDAVAQPVFQGGTLLVYLVFIFVQDPVLGLAAVALYPVQGVVIPILQRKVNQLGKARVRAMRQISDRIGETVAGIQDIHNHDTSAYHLADLSRRYGDVYDIRFEIYQRKFFIKFLNNFINQLTPFFFYAIGGYLVIRGSLSFGALVAVLSAYKDLAGPWRELLAYYQQVEDARIKYEQVIEQFDPPGLMAEGLLVGAAEEAAPAPAAVPLTGDLVFRHVGFAETAGPLLLEGISVTIPLTGCTAVVNAGGSGGDEFALLAARLLMPSTGTIMLGDRDFRSLPEAVTGRRLAYAGPGCAVFSGSLRDNLLYGLRHRPVAGAAAGPDPNRRARAAEAEKAGNSTLDPTTDWTDTAATGFPHPDGFRTRLVEVMGLVDLEADVYGFGLRGTIDPHLRPDLAWLVLEARHAARTVFDTDEMRPLIERFDWDRFNSHATVAENLLFGTPVDDTFATDSLAGHPYVRRILQETGLFGVFLEAGHLVATTMVEMFADLPPGHELFERFSFISAEDLRDLPAVLQRTEREGIAHLGAGDQERLIGLVFKLIPSRHRMGVCDPPLMDRVVAARHAFAAGLPDDLRPSIAPFDAKAYNAAASLLDNILFGRLAHTHDPDSGHRLQQAIDSIVEARSLRPTILDIGLEFQAGVGGSRLTSVQRSKLVLARALLKNPDLLVLNQATIALDGATQAKVHQAVLADRRGRGILWIVHRPSLARSADLVVVLHNGQIVEQGPPSACDRPGRILRTLIGRE